jgi:hypothetical protein
MPATDRTRQKDTARYARSCRKGTVTYRPTADDRKTVRSMVTVGFNQPTICLRLGITDKTLRKYYRVELDTAHLQLVQNMRMQIIERSNYDTQALIYVNRVLGWSDRPMQPAVNVNIGTSLATMDEDAMRAELAEILTAPCGRRLTIDAEAGD